MNVEGETILNVRTKGQSNVPFGGMATWMCGILSMSSGTFCGCDVVAEGVETEAELAVLRGLGIKAGQGYLLGRPALPD